MIRNRFFLFLMVSLFLGFQALSFQKSDNAAERNLATRELGDGGSKLTAIKPADLGIDPLALESGIRSIILQALDSAAFPGCQVLLAKGGKVFYHQSFGYQTYDSLKEVKNSDIYDLASVTKTTAATLSLMKLYDQGLFDPEETFGHYFPEIAKKKKKNMVMRDVLAHQAGLRAWIPYYSVSKKKNGKYKRNTIANDSSARFPYRISETGLFLHKDYRTKKIYKMIKKSKVSDKKSYLYSGLSFYLYPELIQRITGKSFDQYLQDEFYQPLGAKTLGFNAGEHFPLERIVPTEVDSFFRMETLHGVVHDEGAAMMLGVSGNAGLFANSMDLARVYQMLLNGGEYDGKRYLKTSTVEEFTKCQFCDAGNKRGMGFDKPLIEYDEARSSVAEGASAASFGHSGYTGTFVWADPANDLLFVFLSNRVHPTRDNRKIYSLSVRPRIHTLVYDLLQQSEETMREGK